MPHLFDIPILVETVGLTGIFVIIFAESGLFVGFFLPGDSLLLTAGLLASQGYINIAWLAFLAFTAAVLGDSFGYAFGRRVGTRFFNREDSFFFHRKHIDRARLFYERHGKKTIILARFVPIVRTFAPILAGVGEMRYRTFLLYNVIGGFGWAVGLTLFGYFLGAAVPEVDRYLLPIIAGVILLSFLPIIKEIWTIRRKSGRLSSS